MSFAAAAGNGAGALWSAASDRVRRWKTESWVVAGIKVVSVLMVVGNATVGIAEKRNTALEYLGLNQCHQFDPDTDKPYMWFEHRRPCLPGKVTYVKWNYPFRERPGDREDESNRIFQVVSAGDGRVEWREERLVRDAQGGHKWEKDDKFWIAVEGGTTVSSAEVGVPGDPTTGFILRRLDLAGDCSKGLPIAEFFIADTKDHQLHWRMSDAAVPCGQDIGSSFRAGGKFDHGYKATIKSDPKREFFTRSND